MDNLYGTDRENQPMAEIFSWPGSRRANVHPAASRSPAATRGMSLLAYPGGPPPGAAAPFGWSVTSVPGRRIDAAIFGAEIGSGEMAQILEQIGSNLVPIASLGAANPPWADFHAASFNMAAFTDAVTALGEIAERVAGLPASIKTSEDPEILLLARAYTRKAALTAVYDPSTPETISYPVAGPLSGVAVIAEQLAGKGMLTRRFFDRLHCCPDCGSSRLNVREECRSCRSAHLREEGIIHHFSCAHEALEHNFRQDGQLVCPKCAKTLRHIGLDYDKPGSATVCQSCGKADDAASVGFLCLDCGAHRDSKAMPARDWHSYELTGRAVQFLRSGHLDALSDGGRALPQTFRLLLLQALREEVHFASSYAVLRLNFLKAASLRQDDERLWHETLRMAEEIVNGALRPVDVTVQHGDGFLILMPRTMPAEAGGVAGEIGRHLKNTLRVDPEMQPEILDRSRIDALLEETR